MFFRMVYKSGQIFLQFCHNARVWQTDRRTDRQTGISSLYRVCITCSAVKMLCSRNLILCRLAKCCDARTFALAAKYHDEPHDVVRSSAARIKDSFWFYFSE